MFLLTDPIPYTLALDSQDIINGATLAHEIGHACFKFLHPDNDVFNPVCDPNNFMFFTSDNQKPPCLGKRINNIRAYHFKEIHQIR